MSTAENPDWSIITERTAQGMLNQPGASVDLVQDLKDQLFASQQYTIMAEQQPYKAAEQIVRHLRKPVMAAFTALAFHHAMHDTLPILEEGLPIAPDIDITYKLEEELVVSDCTFVTGAAARYMFGIHSILDPAWEKIVADIAIPGTPSAHFMEAFEPLQNIQKLLKPGAPTPYGQIAMLPNDNAIVSLELLTRARIDYADDTYRYRQVPDANKFKRRALKSAVRLGWGTSANRQSLGYALHKKRLSEKFGVVETYDPSLPAEEIAKRTSLACVHAESGEFALAKAPLTDKPWAVARFCPASMTVLMPGAADRHIAKRFNDYCHRQMYANPRTIPERQGPIEDLALIDLGAFVMQLGALVGQETIFRDWPNIDLYESRKLPVNTGSF